MTVYSQIRQSGGVSAHTASDQSADRSTKASLTVTLSCALRGFSWSRVCRSTGAQTVSRLLKICSDDSRVIKCFQYLSEDNTVWKKAEITQQTPCFEVLHGSYHKEHPDRVQDLVTCSIHQKIAKV